MRKTFSDETVTVFAMQLVKAATDQQEYVTLDVFLDGEENFVTTVVHLLMLNAPSDTCIYSLITFLTRRNIPLQILFWSNMYVKTLF